MRLIRFFKALIQSNSKESSKRFIAIYTVLGLISYVVVRFTNAKNMAIVLGQLIAFVLTILGVAVWQDIKNKSNKK